jgi:hypothetical protein
MLIHRARWGVRIGRRPTGRPSSRCRPRSPGSTVNTSLTRGLARSGGETGCDDCPWPDPQWSRVFGPRRGQNRGNRVGSISHGQRGRCRRKCATTSSQRLGSAQR